MSLELILQPVCDELDMPAADELAQWVRAAGARLVGTVVVRVVDVAESKALNQAYRGRDAPTNVLSFPFAAPAEFSEQHLGDLVICAEVVAREAAEQHKSLTAHWAHMIVHGILHLRGFVHESEVEAARMERQEIAILSQLGFANPYYEVI